MAIRFFLYSSSFLRLTSIHCIAEQSLHHLNSWPHIERRTTCCDGQYNFWLVIPSHGCKHSFIVYFSFFFRFCAADSLLFFFFNFIRDINRRNIRRKTFKRTEVKERKRKRTHTKIRRPKSKKCDGGWEASATRYAVNVSLCVVLCSPHDTTSTDNSKNADEKREWRKTPNTEDEKKKGKKSTVAQCTERRPQEPAEKDKDLLNNYLVFINFFIIVLRWMGGWWMCSVHTLGSCLCTQRAPCLFDTHWRRRKICFRLTCWRRSLRIYFLRYDDNNNMYSPEKCGINIWGITSIMCAQSFSCASPQVCVCECAAHDDRGVGDDDDCWNNIIHIIIYLFIWFVCVYIRYYLSFVSVFWFSLRHCACT